MRGHVRKRGSKWCVVVDVGRDQNGNRKQKWLSGFKRRKDAEVELAKVLGQLPDGSYVEPSKLTVGAFLTEQWLPAVRASLRPGTFASYERNVRSALVPRVGDVPLQQLTPARLNAMYGELLESGRCDGSGGLSPRTVRYIHTILRRALAAAVRWSLVVRNVADLADPPSPKAARAKPPKTWTAQQVGRFLVQVRDHRLYALWHLLASTGMRRGEALGGYWTEVDLDGAAWSVRHTLVEVGHEPEHSEPKTDHGRRSVALDAGTVAVLRDWRKRQLEERLAWGPAWTDTRRVFTREDGNDLHPERVSELFDRLVKRSGLPRLTVHGLRHTHATLALQAGVHPKVVQERLGHSSVAFTLDRYSHAIPAMQQDAAATVARLVGLD
jgi:integrase